MLIMKKKIILPVVLFVISVLLGAAYSPKVDVTYASTSSTISGKWIKDTTLGKWWYRHTDGFYTVNAWEYISGTWYHFDSAGWMQTGWIYTGGNWYYLGNINDGSMKSGWQYINGSWYYLGDAADGSMKSGWQYINGNWYYLGDVADGSMKSDWQYINGSWYYLGDASDGSMKYGWQRIFGEDYYFGDSNDGAMKTGKLEIGGETYYLDIDGKRLTSAWCEDGYLGEDGKLIPGYAEDNPVSYIEFMYYPDVPSNAKTVCITEEASITKIQTYLLGLDILENPNRENVMGGEVYNLKVVFQDGTTRICYITGTDSQMYSNGRYYNVNMEDVEVLWNEFALE